MSARDSLSAQSAQTEYVTIIDSVHPAYRDFLIGIDTLDPLSMSREETNAYLMKKSTELNALKASITANASDKRKAYFEGNDAITRFEDIKTKFYLFGLSNLPSEKKSTLEMGQLGFFSRSGAFNISKQLKDLFYTFPEDIQQSVQGKDTWALLTRLEPRIGENMRLFEQQLLIDTAGGSTSLKSIMDQPVPYKIIFFGASWCTACRIREHRLKTWHHLLDPDKVSIINISVDKTEKAWLKSVAEDELPWPSYLLPEYSKAAIYQHFKLDEGIPRVLLLDTDNNILFEHSDIRMIVSKLPFIRYEIRI